jgi:hypothetical protein
MDGIGFDGIRLIYQVAGGLLQKQFWFSRSQCLVGRFEGWRSVVDFFHAIHDHISSETRPETSSALT